jgi:hypothetical protein
MNEEEQRKQLAIAISDVIQHLLRDSDELAEALEHAHQAGYDVFLSFLSGIVVRRKEAAAEAVSDGENPVLMGEKDSEEELPEVFEFTEQDLAFLKSIGIQAPE